MPRPLASDLADRLESLDALDAPAHRIGKAVRDAVPAGAVKDTLSGVQIGHALHPLLTDLPIGTWTSATILDLLGGRGARGAADLLVAAGLAATPATVATGLTDWADSEFGNAGVRRAGLLHAALNTVSVGLMTASLVARRRGARARGTLLSLAGVGVLGAGGWLGGHLSYAQGVGVDNTVFDVGPDEWTSTGVREAELGDGRPRCVMAEDVPVFLIRRDGAIHALHNRCTHRGGPLSDGEIGDGTVTCPWHGSIFSIEDGGVVRGPAAYPQPRFEARTVSDGEVEVRRVAH